MQVDKPVNGLAEFFRPWRDILNHLFVDAEVIARVIYEAAEDASRDNVLYVEFRQSPFGVLNGGLSLEEFTKGVEMGISRAEDNLPIKVRMVLSLTRHYLPYVPEVTRRHYYGRLLNHVMHMKKDCIVGFDLAGKEKRHPPRLFADFFHQVKQLGFPVTIHAGEFSGPENIKEAIEVIAADRIGHGLSAVRSPELMSTLREKKIPLELCPTSNILTSAVQSISSHPVRTLYDAGIVVTVNTDDPSVCNTTLSKEFTILVQHFGFSKQDIHAVTMNAVTAAFLPAEEKEELLAKIR